MSNIVVKDFHGVLSQIEDIKTSIKDSQYKKIVDMLMKLQKQSEAQDHQNQVLRLHNAKLELKVSKLEVYLLKLSIKHLKLDEPENCPNICNCDEDNDLNSDDDFNR